MAEYFDKNEIYQRALKLYESGKIFVSFMQDEALFPFVIKLKKIKQSDIQKEFTTVLKESQSLMASGLELTCKRFEFKNIGTQTLPVSVHFNDRKELLLYIGKEEEFEAFVSIYTELICKYPALKVLLLKKPHIIIGHRAIWKELMAICDFFLSNPRPNVYIRALSIEGIDTKFIEKNRKIIDLLLSQILDDYDRSIVSLKDFGFEKKYHLKYPLPMVRFRILDRHLSLSGLDDLSITIEAFKKLNLTCKNVFIVENKMTTLSFPALKDAIVIFGSGYGATIFKDVAWLKEKNIYYWGDIDADGFAILSQIRGYFPKVKSLFMDESVVTRFKNLSVTTQNSTPFKKLDNLSLSEQKLY
ncbi:MAG: DUF2220 family protein, partial [Campylobacterota bacterium]|nr:DUF2220 family protein [Campylobacterota bacterium]